MPLFERMLVAGVGLIGASLGLAARRAGLVGEIVGFGRSEENLRIALRRGAVDRYSSSAAEAAAAADLVVLAVPVRATRGVAEAVLPHARPDAVVVDAGSVKVEVVDQMRSVVRPPARFVGCHPIAGTEHSGAAHAFAELFEHRLCVVTPVADTDADGLRRVRAFWEGVGMRVEEMSPDAHDRLFALVSHLPHVVAYALVDAVESERVAGRDPLAYSGGGFRDTTRIASSHADMWRDVCLANRGELLRAIDGFAEALARLRALVEASDGEGLRRELERIRAARARLADR